MALILRRGTPEDAEACASICQVAFAAIADQHNFPPDFPSLEPAQQLMTAVLSRDDVFAVVADLEGPIVGSNFVWESGRVGGVGPSRVGPSVQNRATGRRLREGGLRRGRDCDPHRHRSTPALHFDSAALRFAGEIQPQLRARALRVSWRFGVAARRLSYFLARLKC